MTKRRNKVAQSANSNPVIPLPQLLQSLVLGGYTATLVAAALIPTDVVPRLGTGLGLIACWFILLLVWWLGRLTASDLSIRWGPTTLALVIFLSLHTLSGLVMIAAGNPRSTVNMIWLWLGLGLVFWLGRQLLRTPAECRAIVSVMIALAVCLSMYGYYQYFVSLPRTRAAYRQDPEAALRQAGVIAPPGTPQRKHFEDRLYSSEPIATFTLTNSLAGFLAPWLVAAAGISFTNWSQSRLRTRLAIMALSCALLIGGCWILTKSRTSWLAVALGLALLVIYGRRSGWQPSWRLLTGGAGLLVLLAVLAAVVGGLDWFVLSESSKALLYRLQYWQSTAELIRDYPWFGCGPGNFQQFYNTYKLPQASESVATPHNLLFEIWATAGTPAIVAWIGVLVCFVWQLRHTSAAEPASGEPASGQVRTIYWGALAGVLLAFPVGAIAGDAYMPAVEILAVGVPPAALTLLAGHSWVQQGQLPQSVVAAALCALLFNFLGAGGISYAGVAASLWLVMAVTLNLAEFRKGPARLPRAVFLSLGVGITGLALLYFQTMYFPIIHRHKWISEGELSARIHGPTAADAAFRAAADADPYAADPWIRLAQLRFSQWLGSGSQTLWQAFDEAAEQALIHDRRSSEAYSRHAHWLLTAYRQRGEPRHLERAIAGYRRAIELYPYHNSGHAQLAWALHLAGEAAAAASAAEEALRLDALTPHSEQKLSVIRLFDPGPQTADQLLAPNGNAEQMMQHLRSGVVKTGASGD